MEMPAVPVIRVTGDLKDLSQEELERSLMLDFEPKATITLTVEKLRSRQD